MTVESTGFRRRGGEVSRLEGFSDAVFAFALALLVVSTDVPGSTAELYAILGDFPAFGATFAVLVWIWHQHHVYFRRFGFVNAVTTFLNAVLLFLVLFYVYPLKFLFGALFDGLVGQGWAFTPKQGPVLMVLYSLGFASVFAMFAFLYQHALGLRSKLELNELEVLITRAKPASYSSVVRALGLLPAPCSAGRQRQKSRTIVVGRGHEWGILLSVVACFIWISPADSTITVGRPGECKYGEDLLLTP